MNLKSLLNLVVVLLVGQLLFSCNSGRYYEFAAHKQQPYHQLKQKPAPDTTPTVAAVALAAAEEKAAVAAETPQLEANAATKQVTTAPKAAAPVAKTAAAIAALNEAPVVALTEAEMVAGVKEKMASLSRAEKKELKKEIRETLRQRRGNSSTSTIILVLLCLIPFIGAPLAVFLHRGISTEFWITVVLSLLGAIPGIIYGILVVTDTI